MGITHVTIFFFICLFSTAFKWGASDIPIIHIYGKGSPFASTHTSSAPSWLNNVSNFPSKDLERFFYLSNLATSKEKGKLEKFVPIAPGLNLGNYLIKAEIGSQALEMFMVFDISNDIAWIPCSGCAECSSSVVFSPLVSSTYQIIGCTSPECDQVPGYITCQASGYGPCWFNQTYGGDGSSFRAILSHDSMKLGRDIISNYAFGCINKVFGNSIPAQGLIGLGRGSMSLMSQAKEFYSGIFSYCLPSYKSYNFSGSLKLGPNGQPRVSQTTPILKNPVRPSLYYVNLLGVSVGNVEVPIDKDKILFNPETGGGAIIDSGTVITRFVRAVYVAIRDELKQQVRGPFSSLGAFDTCFPFMDEYELPSIIIHFDGMDLELPLENTYMHLSSGSVACLAMAASPDNVNVNLNIIANFQQQNLRVMIDNENSRLGIGHELCS